MLRRAGSSPAKAVAAGGSDGANVPPEKRSWADMRARLRQGRKPAGTFDEPEPSVASEPPATAENADGPSPQTHAAVGEVGEVGEVGTPHGADGRSRAPCAAACPEVEAEDHDATPETVPAQSEAAAIEPLEATCETADEAESRPDSGCAAAKGGKAEPPPSAAAPAPAAAQDELQPALAGTLLGHVISVAGALVWGVLESDVANLAEIGAVVRLHNGRGKSVGLITTLKSDGRRLGDDDRRLVEIRLLGEILADGPAEGRFQRGVSSYPPLDSPIHAATPAELVAMYAPPAASTVRLGTLSHTSNLPAYALTDNLLGKHFAVLGSTGAGKSCAVTVILRAILDANPYGHIVMLDPHNEYGRAFGERAELLNPGNLKLPYWLLNYEELASLLVSSDSEQAYAEAAILKDALLGARRSFAAHDRDAEHVTVDTPIPYRLSELVKQIKEAMGAFNRPESTAAYQHLISRIESMSGDKRYGFMFSSFLVQDTMLQVLSRILRIPVEGRPITIIDISGVPSEIVDVVVSVLFRLIFEFALWSDRTKSPPILLVCEEAHRYVPGDDQAGFAPTKRSISRIAKEGRKYGLSLGLITQRPSELATSSLSQCNTIFALRLSNDRDLEFVRAAVTDSSRWLTDTLPALNTQEAVVLGDGVAVPMHIRFNDLDPDSRPASTTPVFSTVWQGDVAAEPLIRETIERWRHQIRADEPAD